MILQTPTTNNIYQRAQRIGCVMLQTHRKHLRDLAKSHKKIALANLQKQLFMFLLNWDRLQPLEIIIGEGLIFYGCYTQWIIQLVTILLIGC